MDEEDHVLKPVWDTSSSLSHDFLNDTLLSDEEIIEAMNVSDRPCDDIHHFSCFLLEHVRIEQDDFRFTLSEIVGHAIVPLDMHEIYAEGNMVSIYPTITIDISRILGKIENVYISANCSPEEI
jgi:mannose-6-phosphate isomerase class I